jgi:hypothetical protein
VRRPPTNQEAGAPTTDQSEAGADHDVRLHGGARKLGQAERGGVHGGVVVPQRLQRGSLCSTYGIDGWSENTQRETQTERERMRVARGIG